MSTQREKDLITKNSTDVDYHNTCNIRLLQKLKTEDCRALSWLPFTLFVREIPQKLGELLEIPNLSPKSGPQGVAHTRKAVRELGYEY